MCQIESDAFASSQVLPTKAKLVPQRNRGTFLPRFFGPRHVLKGESLVFDWMTTLSQDYNGGLWDFYTLQNGGFYMAPQSDKRFHIMCAGNGYEGEMTADAAGIVATLFALSQLSIETNLDQFSELFHSLREFAMGHAESGQIFAAID